MANVVQLSRYRKVTRRDLPLDIPAGDSDLLWVAAMLWLGSSIRTLLTLEHHEVFGVESTLALVCALVIPVFLVHARHARDTAKQ